MALTDLPYEPVGHYLFNDCTDWQPPDWSLFDAFEIAGVYEDPETESCERVDDAADATFYSVYGHLKEGGCECLSDWSTAKLAHAAAVAYGGLSGITTIYVYANINNLQDRV